MRDEMIATGLEGTMAHFDFECPGCGECGELEIDTETGAYKPFGCPEIKCGATFLLWQHNLKWKLRAVVVPVFKKAV